MAKKIRVNITVDSETLKKAKKKLNLFGGKLSTLFDAYLREFVESMDKEYNSENKAILQRIEDLEERMSKLEKK